MSLLELHGVTVGYGAAAARQSDVVADASLSLAAGELCAVLGPNGAGKSTLLRAVVGLLPLRSGRIELAGDDAAGMTRIQRAQRVAMVSQRSELPVGFSVREVVAMGRAPHQGRMLRPSVSDERETEAALTTCGLAPLAARPIEQLSGGELQRVHLARALAQQTPVLLLDEASAHLDVLHSLTVHELLRERVAELGLACLAVMHDLNVAARYASRVLLMRDGAIVADGPVAEVMTAAQLGEVFQVEMHVASGSDGHPVFVASAALAAASGSSPDVVSKH